MPDPLIRGLPTGIRWRMNPGDNPFLWSQGTAFPPNPVQWQRCFREDVLGGTEFFYKGTRWVGSDLMAANSNLIAATVTNSDAYLVHAPDNAGLEVESASVMPYVVAPNNGTNYWNFNLRMYVPTGASDLNLGSFANTSADAADVWIEPKEFGDVPQAIWSSEAFFLYVRATKTNSPGALYLQTQVRYRVRSL